MPRQRSTTRNRSAAGGSTANGGCRRRHGGCSPFWLAGALALIAGGVTPGRAQEDACVDCHEVDPDALAESVHGFLECVDCHAGGVEVPHAEEDMVADCSVCHEETVADLEQSIHGMVRAEEGTWFQGCASCHGPAHQLRPGSDPDSPVHPRRLPATCGSCHADPKMAERLDILLIQPIEAYSSSVHAREVEAGQEAATCNDCHRTHAIFPAADPRSSVYHRKVPDTCGSCHQEIAEQYAQSVHGLAAEHGVRESPVCTDCHGEHRILNPHDRASPVYATNIPKMTCGRCHGDLRLAEKFGMPEKQMLAYSDSFHGLAVRSGSLTVANCASCHGVHDILPSRDPQSHTSKENLPQTCGKCHPGAGERFALGPVHVVFTEPGHPAVYWARLAYLWIIGLTVGGMLLHNLLDFYRKARTPPELLPLRARDPTIRMRAGFRIAHGLLASSFIILAYTGFALKYPESWWAVPLLQWESSFGLRGWIHRLAAVVMLLAGAIHIAHLAASRRARACIAEMRPCREDWLELKERVRYFLGRRTEPPEPQWLDYAEKIEYLAVIWGTVLMGITGFALWFEEVLLRWLPLWVADLATVIHFYEAVLATLAILIWHLYSVIFDPLVYPMDTAWITGHSTRVRPHPQRRRAEGANFTLASPAPRESET